MTTANTSVPTLPASVDTGEVWAATIARIHDAANLAVSILLAGPAKVSSKEYGSPIEFDVAKQAAKLQHTESLASAGAKLMASLPDAGEAYYDEARSARLKGTKPGSRSTIATLILAIGAAKPMTRGAARKLIASEFGE